MTDQNQPAGSLTDAIEATIEGIRRGRVVMIIDPVRPERGGILAAAAERVTDDLVNFMATHARAIVAVALAPERIERLALRRLGGSVAQRQSGRFISARSQVRILSLPPIFRPLFHFLFKSARLWKNDYQLMMSTLTVNASKVMPRNISLEWAQRTRTLTMRPALTVTPGASSAAK